MGYIKPEEPPELANEPQDPDFLVLCAECAETDPPAAGARVIIINDRDLCVRCKNKPRRKIKK